MYFLLDFLGSDSIYKLWTLSNLVSPSMARNACPNSVARCSLGYVNRICCFACVRLWSRRLDCKTRLWVVDHGLEVVLSPKGARFSVRFCLDFGGWQRFLIKSRAEFDAITNYGFDPKGEVCPWASTQS